MAGSSITERGWEADGAFAQLFSSGTNSTTIEAYLDVQHFDIPFPNVILAAPLHCS